MIAASTMTIRPYREVPNPQIMDVAAQYDAAYSHLGSLSPTTGVLLPELHCACIAIELYLKALSAVELEVADSLITGGAFIYAKAPHTSHKLREQFDKAPKDFRDAIEARAQSQTALTRYGTYANALEALEGLFMSSRYPYEPSADISQVSLDALASIVSALRLGINDVPRRFES